MASIMLLYKSYCYHTFIGLNRNKIDRNIEIKLGAHFREHLRVFSVVCLN